MWRQAALNTTTMQKLKAALHSSIELTNCGSVQSTNTPTTSVDVGKPLYDHGSWRHLATCFIRPAKSNKKQLYYLQVFLLCTFDHILCCTLYIFLL